MKTKRADLSKASQLKRPRYQREKRVVREVVAVKICLSGREVCNLKTTAGRAEYKRRTFLMAMRQDWMCGLGTSKSCEKFLNEQNATFDHELGRGSNGGHRDDRVTVDGKIQNRAVCFPCNCEKGSRRGYKERALGVGIERTRRSDRWLNASPRL